MTRRQISRIKDPIYRRLRMALHASPRGQRTSRQKALRDYVSQMLAKETP